MKAKDSAWQLFAIVSFGLGVLLGCDTHARSVNSAKPAGEVQPLFAPEGASLAQQKMCDEQAGKKFKEYGYGKSDNYTSHYDPTVNVCYLRIHSLAMTSPYSVAEVVYDAFGGREFASYAWVSSKDRLDPEVSPIECEIHIPGKPDEKCKTQAEFDQLTERYFGVSK